MRVLMTPLEWMLVGLLNKQRAMMSVTAMVRTVNKAKAWAKGNKLKLKVFKLGRNPQEAIFFSKWKRVHAAMYEDIHVVNNT